MACFHSFSLHQGRLIEKSDLTCSSPSPPSATTNSFSFHTATPGLNSLPASGEQEPTKSSPCLRKESPGVLDSDWTISRMVDESEPADSTAAYELDLDFDSDEELKRPPNCFMLFAKEHRTKILAEHENQLSNQEVSKILGARWKGMSLEEKKPFIGKAARIRKEFKKKYPDFSWHKEKGKKRNCDSQKHKHTKSKKKSKTHKLKRNPEPRRVEGISEAFLDFEDKWQKARESELIMTQIMEGKAKVWTEMDKEPPEDKTVIYLPVLVDRGLYVKEFFNNLKNMGNIYITLSVANNNNDKDINLLDHCNKEASLPEYRELLVENDMSVQYIMSNAFLTSDSEALRDSLDGEDTEECVGVALFSPSTDETGGSYDNSVSYRDIDTLRPSERKESINFGNVEGRRKDIASGENQQPECCKTLQESESVDPSTPPTPQSASSFLPMATSADSSSDDFSATSSSLPLFTDELPSHLVEGLPEAGGAWRELLNSWEENAQSPGGVFSPTTPNIMTENSC